MHTIIRKIFSSHNTTRTLRCFATYKPPFTQEFHVNPFSNLKINGNFNIALQPLNINKHINQDRVIVNMICHKTAIEPPAIDCQQHGNEITIESGSGENHSDCLCVVEAPLKANFDVVTNAGGCVSVGSFENDYLKIKTDAGRVELDKFQSGDIFVSTVSGDVSCKKNTQAVNIRLKTSSGHIKTDKLQGKTLEIATDSGSVTTQASYCDRSSFKTKTGNFYLQNVHKTCEICVAEDGYVSLMVFDGTLELLLKRGRADVLLSRILSDSTVSIQEAGNLNLKVVESCFDDTSFVIETADFKNSVKFDDCVRRDGVVEIRSRLKQANVVNVSCSQVNIENVSVLDLFRLLK